MQLLKLVLACFLQTFRCAAPCDHFYWNDGKIGMMEEWNYGKPKGKPQRGVILVAQNDRSRF
jgi:hypothetical protein